MTTTPHHDPPDGGGSSAATSAGAPSPKHVMTIGAVLRNRMFAGMVILLPAGLTLWVTWRIGLFLHESFQGWLKPNLRELTQHYPLLAAVLANEMFSAIATVLIAILLIAAAIYLVGLLSTAYAVRRTITLGERIIQLIPFAGFLYGLLKQIMDAIALQRASQGKMQRLVLVEYPRRGIFALAFVTGETRVENTGDRFVNVFLPTTPNPTSGFLLLLPPSQVFDTNLTMDQSVSFIMSGGILAPENFHMVAFNPGAPAPELPPAFIPTPGTGPQEIVTAETGPAETDPAETD